MLCSFWNLKLNVIKKYQDLPKKDSIIIWHHSEIPDIIEKYTNKNINFKWPSDNYNGCVIIKDDEWEFINNYFL